MDTLYAELYLEGLQNKPRIVIVDSNVWWLDPLHPRKVMELDLETHQISIKMAVMNIDFDAFFTLFQADPIQQRMIDIELVRALEAFVKSRT